jgi:hypothetical protein
MGAEKGHRTIRAAPNHESPADLSGRVDEHAELVGGQIGVPGLGFGPDLVAQVDDGLEIILVECIDVPLMKAVAEIGDAQKGSRNGGKARRP